MSFNLEKDKIAITVPKFTLLRHVDGPLQKYNEPYIVSAAVDSTGKANPSIDFSFMPFPKIGQGGTVTMLGDGHLLYGPKNPGDFVAISILIMESDSDIRELGNNLEKILKSKAVDLGIGAIIAANLGYSAILGSLKELTQLIAGFLKDNGDDELFRIEGSFLKGHPVPYHINRSYEVGNDYVKLCLNIIPLAEPNGQGPEPRAIVI